MKWLLVIALSLATAPVAAAPESPVPSAGRYELWMGVTGWPALGDLRPLAAGEFDMAGFALGAAFHAPLKRFERSELLAGVDLYIGGTMSNVSGIIDDVIARDMYLGASLKWALGRSRSMQLDAGLGYHLVDMAQVSSHVFGLEHEAWESSRLGAVVGATWDAWARKENSTSGLSLAFKVHFVDFGMVRDEDVFLTPILGPDAGSLEGPIYLLQVGYSAR